MNGSAAARFVYANGRLLERHRLAALTDTAAVGSVIEALRGYRNDDGGFGHALEPDVRAPTSEPASTLAALEVLGEIGRLADAMVRDAATWIATIARDDGGIPFVLPAAAAFPRAPWMEPSAEASHLTFALAAALWQAGATGDWLERATDWCWATLEAVDEMSGYWVKFGLAFLDHAPDSERAERGVERLRTHVRGDGSVAVPGGTEHEALTPLDLSPRPGSRSRALFTDEQIQSDLNRLELGQQEDGGWMFDWLAWSPGQAVEWRGIVTVRALTTLAANGRVADVNDE